MSYRAEAQIGNVFGDAWDDVSGAASDVADAAASVVDIIPGVSNAVAFFGDELKDFANTTLGEVFLQIVTTSVFGGMAQLVGPQLAAISFALPGLAKGDDFDKAWTDEFLRRCEKLAEILGADAAGEVVKDFQPTIDQLVEQAKAAGLDPQAFATKLEDMTGQQLTQLAAQLGVRPDMLQSAVDFLAKKSGFAVSLEDLEARVKLLATMGLNTTVAALQAGMNSNAKTFDPSTGAVVGGMRMALPPSMTMQLRSNLPSVGFKTMSAVSGKATIQAAQHGAILARTPTVPHLTADHPLAMKVSTAAIARPIVRAPSASSATSAASPVSAPSAPTSTAAKIGIGAAVLAAAGLAIKFL